MEWNVREGNAMEWNVMEWKGMECNVMLHYLTSRDAYLCVHRGLTHLLTPNRF